MDYVSKKNVYSMVEGVDVAVAAYDKHLFKDKLGW